MTKFTLVDKYMLSRLGVSEENFVRGKLNIIESDRRTKKELSYGYLYFLWWVEFIDGTQVLSIPPGYKNSIGTILKKYDALDIENEQFCNELKQIADSIAQMQTGKGISLCLQDVMYACDKNLIKCIPNPIETFKITDKNLPAVQGLRLPLHCIPDGIVYGVLADGHIASVAYAHRTSEYQDIVADIGVETAPDYRRRGFAKAVVAAVAMNVISRGGEALYKCDPNNLASQATARSVGFILYGKSLIFAVR